TPPGRSPSIGYGITIGVVQPIPKLAIIPKPRPSFKFHATFKNANIDDSSRREVVDARPPKGPRPSNSSTRSLRSTAAYRVATSASHRRLRAPAVLVSTRTSSRRVLAKHCRPEPGSDGPSWLSVIGHAKDSLWSINQFRCESILLRNHWVIGGDGRIH